MPLPRRFAAVTVLAVAVCTSTACLPGQLTAQTIGWSYTTNTTVDSGGPQHTTSIATRERVTDRFLRSEFLQVSGLNSAAGSAEGIYTVYDARDSTMRMVMTTQHMATVMNAPVVGASSLPRFSVHRDEVPKVEDLGAGETILGHATHHYRTTTHGSVDYLIGTESCTRRIDAVSDTWMAPDVDIRPALDAVMKHFNHGAVSPTPMPDSAPSFLTRGTPLRSVSVRSYTDQSGAVHNVKTTIEYTEIIRAPIEDEAFMVPADYQVLDMRETMAKLQAKGVAGLHPDSIGEQAGRRLAKAFCQ